VTAIYNCIGGYYRDPKWDNNLLHPFNKPFVPLYWFRKKRHRQAGPTEYKKKMNAVSRERIKYVYQVINNFYIRLFIKKRYPMVKNNHQNRIPSEPIHPIVFAIIIHVMRALHN
jgi:hypothetical protein